jgi:outer membrane autotransporter protein
VESAGDFRADVQLRGRWVHEFGDTQADVDAAFASTPAIGFNVRDQEISRDSAVLGAGVSVDMSATARVYVDYDTRLNRDESIQVVSAALQYRW